MRLVEVELVLVLGILSPLVTSAKAWPPSMWTQADSPEVSRKFCLGCSFLGPRSWGVGHFILLVISLFCQQSGGISREDMLLDTL